MHVGIYTGNYYPKVGGGYTFVKDIIEHLIMIAPNYENHFTIFTTSRFKKEILEKKIPNNISIIEVGKQTGIINRLRSILQKNEFYEIAKFFRTKLEKVAINNKVDIMWFAGHENWAIDIPYISTVWDLGHLTNSWFPELSANFVWEQREGSLNRNLRRSTKVVTGTQVGKKELISFYGIPEDRIHILTHPTPSFVLKSTIPGNNDVLSNYEINNRYLFYPAQFWAHKNHINLLKALRLLNETRNSKYDLVLVGSDQGNKSFVENRAKQLGIKNNVHFLGFVPTDELISFYKNAIALIYPSLLGPENLPPLEAFALKCPVLMAEYPGAREQLGDETALFFNPLSPRSIVNAITKLESNTEKKLQLIIKGKERASKWTAKEFIEELMIIINEFEPVRSNWA